MQQGKKEQVTEKVKRRVPGATGLEVGMIGRMKRAVEVFEGGG